MKTILLAFISVFNRLEIIPAEKEIDAFLVDSSEYGREVPEEAREHLIRFTFYHWEKRLDKTFLDQILKTI